MHFSRFLDRPSKVQGRWLNCPVIVTFRRGILGLKSGPFAMPLAPRYCPILVTLIVLSHRRQEALWQSRFSIFWEHCWAFTSFDSLAHLSGAKRGPVRWAVHTTYNTFVSPCRCREAPAYGVSHSCITVNAVVVRGILVDSLLEDLLRFRPFTSSASTRGALQKRLLGRAEDHVEINGATFREVYQVPSSPPLSALS